MDHPRGQLLHRYVNDVLLPHAALSLMKNLGAMSWVSCGNDNLKGLTDPNNLLIYQMHQYLDSDNSGTHAECVSSTIFQERLDAATSWLRSNKKYGMFSDHTLFHALIH